MRRTIPSLISLAMMMPIMGYTAEVYRTVDDSGHVTFTDAPAGGAVTTEIIPVHPAPSPEAVRETESRTREIRRQLEQAERKRNNKESTQRSSLLEAEVALKEAEARLVSSKEMKEGDRQSLVGGKSKIHPDYFERIKKAEAAVEEAKDRLKQLRGY